MVPPDSCLLMRSSDWGHHKLPLISAESSEQCLGCSRCSGDAGIINIPWGHQGEEREGRPPTWSWPDGPGEPRKGDKGAVRQRGLGGAWAESAQKAHRVALLSTCPTPLPPSGESPLPPPILPSSPLIVPQLHQEHRSSGSVAGPGPELSLGVRWVWVLCAFPTL